MTRISFQELADFGLNVADAYEMETKKRTVLLFNADEIQGLIVNYSEYFEIEDEKTLKMIAKQFHNRYNRMEL